MDIISEILETDHLAEAKIEAAKQQRSEMLEECEKQAEKIRQEARDDVEAHLKAAKEEAARTGEENSKKLSEGEKDKLSEFEALYDSHHAQWEKSILDAILED